MKIPFLPSILMGVIFDNIDPHPVVQETLSWTIPEFQPERPTPTQHILEARETATWTFPIANSIANAVFTIGNVVNVQWTTDFDFYYIFLWQQDLKAQFANADPDPIFSKNEGDAEPGGFNWTASTESFLLSDSNVFFFSLGQNQSLTGVFTDHYFNLTEKEANTPKSTSSTTSKTTSSVISSTSKSSATITSSSTTPTTASATSGIGALASSATTTLSTTKDASSTSSTTKLGIGLGLGLGIPIILLLSALVFLKFRNTNKDKQVLPSPTISETPAQQMHLMQGPPTRSELSGMNPSAPTSFYNKNWRGAELDGYGVPSELDGSRATSELP